MWHKADWGWMRRWVYLPELKRLRLNWMVGVAWQEGGLKNDPKYLERVTGIPRADIADLWDELIEVMEQREDRWMLSEQWAAYDDKLRIADRNQKAGLASAEARKKAKHLRQQDVDGRSTSVQQTSNIRSISGQHPAYSAPSGELSKNSGSLKIKDFQQHSVDDTSTKSNESQPDKSRVDESREEKAEGADAPHVVSAPFDPVGHQFEGALPGTVWQALEDLFPGEAANHGKIKQLAEIAAKYHATVADIQRWKAWMQQRHPGAGTTYYKFKDFFAEMMEEGVGAAAWLNGSIGGRFCLFAVGYKPDSPVPPKDRDLIISTGKWLDGQVKLDDKQAWYDQGLTPENFSDFWKDANPTLFAPPKPESVMRRWDDFRAWLGKTDD